MPPIRRNIAAIPRGDPLTLKGYTSVGFPSSSHISLEPNKKPEADQEPHYHQENMLFPLHAQPTQPSIPLNIIAGDYVTWTPL